MPAEHIVQLRSLPRGYSFVPKGNVYITANCRKQTQSAQQPVYVVTSHKNKHIGIAVPTRIHDDVRRQELDTRADRAATVQRKDASAKRDFERVIRQEFPRIPGKSLQQVLKVACEKGKGKVGRTATLSMRQKAHLAVKAHIRHCHTPYENLLRSKVPREKARRVIERDVNSIARSWGPATGGPRQSRPAGAKSAAVKPSRAVLGSAAEARHIIDLTTDDSPEPMMRKRPPLQELPGQPHLMSRSTRNNPFAQPGSSKGA